MTFGVIGLSCAKWVLGAPTPKEGLANSDDLNNIITNSINYVWGGTPANFPPTASPYGVFLTLNALNGSADGNNGSHYTQIFFGYQGDLFFRIAFRDSPTIVTWHNWYKITTTAVNN